MKHTPWIACVLILAGAAWTSSGLAQQLPKTESPAKPRQRPDQQVSSNTRYIVQVGVPFDTAEKADELTSQLRRTYPSAHTQQPSGAETLYRVRIGPYTNREDAQQAANELASQGFKGVIILPLGRALQKPTEPGEKVESAQSQERDDELRRAMTNLSTQIGLLTGEVRKLRRETERNSGMMELLLNEDRLAKLEDKIVDANDRKAQLDAREQEIVRRMRNIQAEVVLRGGLRREETEAAMRNELQRALDDVRSQQATQQQRIIELNEQAARLRARVETLRKRLEQLDVKSETQEK